MATQDDVRSDRRPIMGEDVKLRECPFCGTEDASLSSSRAWNPDPKRPERFWVECANCGAEPFHPTEDCEEAIAAWNTRVSHKEGE